MVCVTRRRSRAAGRVCGRRERHFAGTSLEPSYLPENAATPTRRVHAVLGNLTERKTQRLKQNTTAKLTC